MKKMILKLFFTTALALPLSANCMEDDSVASPFYLPLEVPNFIADDTEEQLESISKANQEISAAEPATAISLFYQILSKSPIKYPKYIRGKKRTTSVLSQALPKKITIPKEGYLKCGACQYSCNAEEKLRKHIRDKHETIPCSKCRQVCRGYTSYKNHMKKVHNQTIM